MFFIPQSFLLKKTISLTFLYFKKKESFDIIKWKSEI